MFDLDAPTKYRMELDSPTMSYLSTDCGASGDEFYDRTHVNWTVTLPDGKTKCRLWTQPDSGLSKPGSPYSIQVNWTKVD